MSGDPRLVLVGDEEGFLARAVDTLGHLPPELPAWAIVGGLGVYLRIGDVHRNTDDLDTVSADRARSLEILADAGAERGGRGLTLPGGIHLDVIELREPSEPGSSVELARRWALDTAESLTVAVRTGAQLASEARLPVATTAALVAMKVHALPRRKSTEKRSNDAYDVVRLVEAAGAGAVARSLSSAPSELRSATAEGLRYYFQTHADSTHKRIQMNRGLPDAAELSELRVVRVGRIAEALDAFGTGRPPLRPESPGRGLPGPDLGL